MFPWNLLGLLLFGAVDAKTPVTNLKPNGVYHIDKDYDYLKPFCHEKRPFSYLGVFASARLEFTMAPSSYDLYEGPSVQDVEDEYSNSKPNWLPLVPWRSNAIVFPPFETKCIGIVSQSSYTLRFRTFNIDYTRLIICVLSLFIFFNARRVVHSKALFYSGGISFGVLASLLALVFILSRLIPQKKTMMATMLLGWSFSVYIFHKIWTNLYDVLHEYRSYVLAYFGLSGMISFALCYRWGPPKNERTVDLVQWLIQLLTLAGVFYSSDIQEVTLAFCLIALVVYNVPARWSAKFRTLVHRKLFKPKVKLMTEEEFYLQGDEVTRLELEKLRHFARSPDCDAWKIMARLKNPQRFGSFVMGDSHLMDNEILEYETSDAHQEDLTLLTDDDSESEVDRRNTQTTRQNRRSANGNANSVSSTTRASGNGNAS